MVLRQPPLVAIHGTNPGVGTTYVLSVLASLSAAEQSTHILDLTQRLDLEQLLRLDTPGPHPSYSPVDAMPSTPAHIVDDVVAARLVADPAEADLLFATADAHNIHARHTLEQRADLRVLVMEPTGRGKDTTATWLATTPAMPTLVIVNALPGGASGRHGQEAIRHLRDTSDKLVTLLTIRKSAAIQGSSIDDRRSPIERIRHHAMLDDYRTIWRWVSTALSTANI